MKYLLDFFSLIIFFIFYKLYDIYLASFALIVTTLLVLVFTSVQNRKIDKIALSKFLIVLIFGTFTLIFHNDVFIKWKVTVIYALFSLTLMISQFVFKKPILQRILSQDFVLPEKILKNMTLSWSSFFLLCSLLNFYIAFWLPQSTWINFKVFGLTAMTLIFGIFNIIYIYPYIQKTKK